MNQAVMLAWCKQNRLPKPTFEFRFATPRRWRFDIAWGDGLYIDRVAVEIEGGVFVRGRHSRGAGMVKDMEKYNRAAVLGWRLLRYTPDQLCSQQMLDDLHAVLG